MPYHTMGQMVARNDFESEQNGQENSLKPIVTNLGLTKLVEWGDCAEIKYAGFGSGELDVNQLESHHMELPNHICELGLVCLDGKVTSEGNPRSLKISVAVSGAFVSSRTNISTIGIYLIKNNKSCECGSSESCDCDNKNYRSDKISVGGLKPKSRDAVNGLDEECSQNGAEMVLFAYVHSNEPIGFIGPNSDFLMNFHLRLTGQNSQLVKLSRKFEDVEYKLSETFWSEGTYIDSVPVIAKNKSKTLTFMDLQKSAFRSGRFDANSIASNKVGKYSTAFGKKSIASGKYSYSQGNFVSATSNNQTVIGSFNKLDSELKTNPDHAFIIGNGYSKGSKKDGNYAEHRSNAFTVSKSGDVAAAGAMTSSGGFYQEVCIEKPEELTKVGSAKLEIKRGMILYFSGEISNPVGSSKRVPKVSVTPPQDSNNPLWCIYHGPDNPEYDIQNDEHNIYPAQMTGISEVEIEDDLSGISVGTPIFADNKTWVATKASVSDGKPNFKIGYLISNEPLSNTNNQVYVMLSPAAPPLTDEEIS